MKILATFKINAVTLTRELAGDENGPLRLVFTLEGRHKAEEVAAMLPTQQAQTAFMRKYWDADGNLLVADMDDKAELAKGIQGGTATIVPAGGFSQPMTFEGVDVKRIRITPEAGFFCVVKLALHLKQDEDNTELTGDLAHMHSTEITLTASRSKADSEREERERKLNEAQGDLLKSADSEAAVAPTTSLIDSLREMEEEDRQAEAARTGDTLDQQEAEDAAQGAGGLPPIRQTIRDPKPPQKAKRTDAATH
jgi:hypothetical protein